MAVVNAYTGTNTAIGGSTSTGTGTLLDGSAGGNIVSGVALAIVAAADDDTSVYRLTRVLSSWVPLDITVQTTAITGGTDYDLGCYKISTAATTGAVVDKDILMDGQTMATASLVLNGMGAVTADLRGKALWELAGLTADPQLEYDLALTANTVGTAAGTIAVTYRFATNG